MTMFSRKEIKMTARAHVRRHYLLLCLLCAVSIFLGAEFTDVVPNAQSWYDAVLGRKPIVLVDGIRLPGGGNIRALARTAQEVVTGQIEGLQASLTGDPSGHVAQTEAVEGEAESSSSKPVRHGALAALVSTVKSGRQALTLASALYVIFRHGHLDISLLTLGAMLLYSFVWAFLRNVYKALMRRAILESRTYEIVPINHMLHLKLVNRWIRVSMTLLLEAVFQSLWNLTVIGGVIKRYSYAQVSFIVAENPDIHPLEAIRLSRRMMNGHKWECFKLDLSFWGWRLLGLVTFGMVSILWEVPYRMATFAEYYVVLREEARARNLEGADRLNDEYLYQKADSDLLKECYAEIVRREDLVDVDIVQLTPIRRFFARNFGIWLGTLAEKKIYSRQEGLRQQMRVGDLELRGQAYPEKLNRLWTRENAELTGKISYLAPCTLWTLAVVFFVFCMVGWLWEVSLHLMVEGRFVNRGMLHGPWLPIYGCGVVMITVLLYRFRRRPAVEAVSIVLVCGFVEYMTSFVMELAAGKRWWDYSGYYLNLNGRICAEGLAVFTVGGMLAIYLLVPIVDAMVTRVPPKALVAVCVTLILLFTADLIYTVCIAPNTGKGITERAGRNAYEDVRLAEQETNNHPGPV